MLIGVCGGICSGKKTVAQYLVEHHGFKRLFLRETSSLGGHSDSSPGVSGDTKVDVDEVFRNGIIKLTAKLEMMNSGPQDTPPPTDEAHTFSTPEELLDFVTIRWRSRFVTTDIPTEAVLDVFSRRPFFLLVSVDAPLTVRWRRYQERARAEGEGEPEMSLAAFVARSDARLFDPRTGLSQLISRAAVRLLNTSSSLAHLYATLGKLDIPNPDRLRPSWDNYFMALASLAAQRSNCMKRRVGCVLVGKGRRVISTGYNGTPRGLRNCAEGGCPRCNEANGSGVGLSTCLCIHAEENALLEAGRERIREGSVLYCDTCPCLTCSIKICQVGIHEVVYAHGYSMDKETAQVFREAGVRLRQFIPPPNGLIHLEKPDLYPY